jgi:hypothetical protein
VNLITITCRNNRIVDLPGPCFTRFQTSLRELKIDDNCIATLPMVRGLPRKRPLSRPETREGLQSLPSATCFSQLTLPCPPTNPAQDMHTLDMLESFSMKGNPVTHPPINYETEGFPTLRNYWKRIDAAFTSGASPSPSRKRASAPAPRGANGP